MIIFSSLLFTRKNKLNETKKNGKYYFFITPYENEDAKNCLNTFFCLCLFFYIVFFSFWDRSRANMLLLYLCILLPHLISCFSFSYCEIIHWTGSHQQQFSDLWKEPRVNMNINSILKNLQLILKCAAR